MAAGSAAGSYVRSYPAKSCKSRRLVLASILQTLAPPRFCKLHGLPCPYKWLPAHAATKKCLLHRVRPRNRTRKNESGSPRWHCSLAAPRDAFDAT